MFEFDLQLFGGKGSSTSVYGRDLTEGEKRLINLQGDVAEAFQPNILDLNDTAKQLLDNSLGAVQVDFGGLNNNAQNQIANAQGNLAGLMALNDGATAAANDTLGNLSDQYGTAAINNYGRLQDAANQYPDIANATNAILGGIIGENANATNAANRTLSGLIGQGAGATDYTNNILNGLMWNDTETADVANAALDDYIRQNQLALNPVTSSLSQLQSGVLPEEYQQNMADIIRGTLEKTMGDTINNMSQRGVINSSLTDSAMNEIAANAAGAVAQNYLNNINTLSNLAQQKYGDTTSNIAQNAAWSQQQLENAANTTSRTANLAQQQLANTENALGNAANLTQQQLANQTNASNTAANLTQQQQGNALNALQGQLGIYGTQYDQLMNSLGQQSGLAQQQLTNTLGTNQQNAGLNQSLIGNATAPITTAAGAQEAAQSPALNLWNASMGLNQSNNGTLAAISSAQPQSRTTTTSGGGGLFGGLLGGLSLSFCFPKGTMVRMADGSKKDISEIVLGDKVADKDGNTANVIMFMPEHENEIWELVTKEGKSVRTTATQPFFLEDGTQKELRCLAPDDALLNMGEIASIKRSGYERVYDFETDGNNNYIVNDGFAAQGGGVDWWEKEEA